MKRKDLLRIFRLVRNKKLFMSPYDLNLVNSGEGTPVAWVEGENVPAAKIHICADWKEFR